MPKSFLKRNKENKMTLARQIAAELLEIKAVYLKPEQPFTWASGIKSPIYTDNRITLSYPKTRTLIEDGFVGIIKKHYPQVEIIAGIATAGIPHGAIVADKMNLPFAYIRSKPKNMARVIKWKDISKKGKRW